MRRLKNRKLERLSKMTTIKTTAVNAGLSTLLGGAMLFAISATPVAEAQSGRIKAKSDRGVATAVRGADGGRAARARGCASAEASTNCASGGVAVGADGAFAGRGSTSVFNEDGSFNRDAMAYGATEMGEGGRLANLDVNADGSGQRTVEGFLQSETGAADRNALLTFDGQGNAARSGAASGSGDRGVFSTEGAGTYSQETGLDYARESQAAAAGENGAFFADGASSYSQEEGLVFENNAGGSFSGENGAFSGQSEASYTLEDGYELDREATASNLEGDTLNASVSYDNEDGLQRDAQCTNGAGEAIACPSR